MSTWQPKFGVPGGGQRPASEWSGRAGKMRDALAGFASNVEKRFDRWVNYVTGFGSSMDKTTYGQILPDRILTDDELSSIYHSDDMAARMVDIIPQEMTREGFSVEAGDVELDTIIADKFDALDLRAKLADGVRWARCFGGSGILLGADDGRLASEPLVPERADDLDYLYVIDRRYLWPLTYYNEPGHPKLGEPATFMVTTLGGNVYQTLEVHESRLILFHGAHTGTRERMLLRGWNLSVLQRAYSVLRQFNSAWQAVETLMVDGTQSIFKIGGLTEILASGGMDVLQQRLQAMNLYRSVVRAIVIDADAKESFERDSPSFEQIPQTLDKVMLRLAASVETPVTILMGQSPAGMNATGESDFRWFYDRVRAQQTTQLGPRVRRVADVWLKTRAGQEVLSKSKSDGQKLTVKFPVLWTETPLAQAQREYAISQRDQIYIQNKVLEPEEVALSRFRPEGFRESLALEAKAQDERQASLAAKVAAAEAARAAAAEPTEEQPESTGGPTLELTSSDLALITKVNEARASVGLPPLDKDGDLTIPEFKAKHATTIAAGAQAEAGKDPNEPEPEPTPPPPDPSRYFGEGERPPGEAPPTDGQEPAKGEEGLPARAGKPGDETALDGGEKPEPRADGPKPFELHREVDETGISGTGIVAEGVVFADGKVALRWLGANGSTTIFESVDKMLAVHGHGGLTTVRYGDSLEPAMAKPGMTVPDEVPTARVDDVSIPVDPTRILTVNELRAREGLGPLVRADGKPDPDGDLLEAERAALIDARAKREAVSDEERARHDSLVTAAVLEDVEKLRSMGFVVDQDQVDEICHRRGLPPFKLARRGKR